jgi:uncharacterized Ntn-hydrolase superfamily protein
VTYSIVARDSATGHLGVAVQSAWFAVGHIVPWVNAGVGVVATQASAEPSYGPRGLSLMRAGLSASTTLQVLLDLDAEREHRQVAMVDASGSLAVHTGARCIRHAEHATGDQVSCQGNILAVPGIPARMLAAYESTSGELVDRLVAALRAAQAAGGDARGQQSAALLVVSGEGRKDLFTDRLFDIRIDDHPTPVDEVVRVLDVQRAYRLLDLSEARVIEGDPTAAADLVRRAVDLMHTDANIVLFGAMTMLSAGRADEAGEIAELRHDIEARVDWQDLARRFSSASALPDSVDEHTFLALFDAG